MLFEPKKKGRGDEEMRLDIKKKGKGRKRFLVFNVEEASDCENF